MEASNLINSPKNNQATAIIIKNIDYIKLLTTVYKSPKHKAPYTNSFKNMHSQKINST